MNNNNIKGRGVASILLLLAFILLSLVFLVYKPVSGFIRQQKMQQRCEEQLQQAVTHFANLQPADTINLASLVPTAWDTVYVFEGNSSGAVIIDKLKHIDWSQCIGREEYVYRDYSRLIFVNGTDAVTYLDVPEILIDGVHFYKYYKSEQGYFESDSIDSNGRAHQYTTNQFARQEAKFVLVRIMNPPVFQEYLYYPVDFYRQHKSSHQKPLETTYELYLHPVRGCGLPTCLANQSNALSN